MTGSALEVAIALGAFGLVYVASLIHRRELDEDDERAGPTIPARSTDPAATPRDSNVRETAPSRECSTLAVQQITRTKLA